MTAAPGPQQPDEGEHVCQCGHPAEFHPNAAACSWSVVFPQVGCPCPALDVRPEDRLRAANRLRWLPHVNARPAAPSAQPERRGSSVPLGHTVVVIRCDVCGQDDHRTHNHAIVADDPEHIPAQPVRDTEEGRR